MQYLGVHLRVVIGPIRSLVVISLLIVLPLDVPHPLELRRASFLVTTSRLRSYMETLGSLQAQGTDEFSGVFGESWKLTSAVPTKLVARSRSL